MGIDIYLGGYDSYNRRVKEPSAHFKACCAVRDKFPQGSAESKAAQELVDKYADQMWAGNMGYLRSSYNNGGLFNVLDTIFGTDSAALLFPGDWAHDLTIDWDAFLVHVQQMKAAAKCLTHGTPLPVRFAELEAEPSKQRIHAEAFGKGVMAMMGQAFGADNVESGNDSQHGFYTDDDYQWYVTKGLDDLEAFGKLGQELKRKRRKNTVHISY